MSALRALSLGLPAGMPCHSHQKLHNGISGSYASGNLKKKADIFAFRLKKTTY